MQIQLEQRFAYSRICRGGITMKLRQYSDVSIKIGGAIAPTAVFTSMIHCRIVEETEKAYQLKAYNMDSKNMELSKHTCWIPKKALIKPKPIPGIQDRYGKL